MKVDVVDVSPVEKRVDIEVPAERVSDEMEEKYEEVRKTVHVRGFRPGKAPRKVLERLFKDHVSELVMKALVEETLETALDRKSIKPVAEPVIDPSELTPGEAYAYTVHVEVRPEIELSEYKGLEVAHTEQVVGDKEVDETIENLRERVAILQPPEADRPIKADDMVTVVAEVKEGGEVIEFGGEDELDIELWRETWIPGLAENFTGKKVDEVVSFTADIPDSGTVPEAYRGKTLSFSFTIKAMRERILPELDDDFAKDNSKFETMDELRSSVRESLAEQAEHGNKSRLEQAVLDKLIELNPIETPPTPVRLESIRMAQDFMYRNTGKRPGEQEAERFAEIFTAEARKIFQASYLLAAVAKAEGIEVSEEEAKEQLEQQAEKMGVPVEKLKAQLGDKAMEMVTEQALLDKALDFLVGAASIKEEAPQEEGEEKDKAGA